MALIHIFKDIGKTHETLQGRGKLSAVVGSVNWDNCIILRAGRRIDKDFVIENDDDIIFIRELPRGLTAALITLAVVSIGVAVGSMIYSSVESINMQEKLDEQQREAKEKGEQNELLPFLKGARNKSSIGKTFPYVMGEMYHTPYAISGSFYTVEGKHGEDQFYNVVLTCGFAPLVFRSISIGNTVIKRFGDTVPQSGVFELDEGTYFDKRNIIEIRQSGAFQTPGFERKVISKSVGEEVKHEYGEDPEPVIVQCEENALAVEVCISFQGLRQYNKGWEEKTVRVVPFWTNNPDDKTPTWHKFKFAGDDKDYPKPEGSIWPDHKGENEFTFNSKKELRFVARKEFSAAESFGKKISVKIERQTPKSESDSQESCYCLFVQTHCFDAKKSDSKTLVPCAPLEPVYRDLTTRIGIRMIANKNTADQLDEFNAIVAGCARIWDGVRWTAAKEPTRNPAAWLLEIITSNAHLHSRYSDNEIDLESFGALYSYCESEKFYTDGIITEGKKKRDTVTSILGTVFSDLIINNEGLLEVVSDKKESTPVALLNSQSVISATVSKSFARKADGRKVTFTNREAWQVDAAYIMRDGGEKRPSDTVTETALEFVTTYGHAYKIARRTLAADTLQPREVKVEVGKEGDYYPLYSTVMLQLAQLRQGIASSVVQAIEEKGGVITAIHIADLVEFVAGYRYGVVIQAQDKGGRKRITAEVYGEGKTRRLACTLRGTSIKPSYGNILSFGLLDEAGGFVKITNVMKITGAAPSDNGWTLTLRDYNEAVYEYGEIPEYKTNLTTPPTAGKELPGITESEIKDELGFIKDNIDGILTGTPPDAPVRVKAVAEETGIFLSCANPSPAMRNTIEYYVWEMTKDNGASWESFEGGQADVYVFDRSVTGYPEAHDFSSWRVRVKAVNVWGLESPSYGGGGIGVLVNTDSYGTWKLLPPAITATAASRLATLQLGQPTRADGREVYGNTRHRIQIQKPEAGDGWFKPATSLNPYESEDNWHEGDGYVEAGNLFTQTLPLTGQTVTKDEDGYDRSNPQATLYRYKVTAYNEAGGSQDAQANVTALGTNIQDIVHGSITHEAISVPNLSSISANLGVISGGTFGDGARNFWSLSNLDLPTGEKRYEGDFRVGGNDQYIRVEPVVKNGVVIDYKVSFKIGSFEVSTDFSKILGNIIVQENDDSLERTRITPKGTYYEYRSNTGAAWREISKQETQGLLTQMLYSISSLVITNTDITWRRRNEHDIGRPMLSSSGVVYHFDTDDLDQYGKSEAAIDFDADPPILAGKEDNNELVPIDFTPAILAVSPFSEIAKSLYGRYSLSHPIGSSNTWTVDLWIQYIWAENQTLLSAGTEEDKVQLILSRGEPYYNTPYETSETGEEDPPYNTEILMTDQVVYNETEKEEEYIFHQGRSRFEFITFKDVGVAFTPNTWLHFAAVMDNTRIGVMINDKQFFFERYNSVPSNASLSLNQERYTFVLDELMIDKTVAIPFEEFKTGTLERVPWGALDWKDTWFILDSVKPENIRTNFFNAPDFSKGLAAAMYTQSANGDMVRRAVVDTVLPVNSIIFVPYDQLETSDPNKLYPGTVWARQGKYNGRVLQAMEAAAKDAGLPNITGEMVNLGAVYTYNWTENPGFPFPPIEHTEQRKRPSPLSASGVLAVAESPNSIGHSHSLGNISENSAKNYSLYKTTFDASRSSKVYGSSTTVQPPAFGVVVFKRIQ